METCNIVFYGLLGSRSYGQCTYKSILKLVRERLKVVEIRMFEGFTRRDSLCGVKFKHLSDKVQPVRIKLRASFFPRLLLPLWKAAIEVGQIYNTRPIILIGCP